jgi:cytochrome c1
MKKQIMLTLALLTLSFSAYASNAEVKLDHEKIPTDSASILRGAELVVDTCRGCHGLKYIKYTDMLELGVDPKTVDEWRKDKPVNARITTNMTPEAATAAYGVVPPDLSLMTSARDGGVHYMYSYLMGYTANSKGETDNKYYPGTRMPDMLGSAAATHPKQRAEISTKAKEITAFLNWAADPHAEDRKQLGKYVIAYLLLLTVLLYFWKVQIWSKLK